MPSQRLIPLAAMEALMKTAGVERVSESAKQALKKFLEERAKQLIMRAAVFAQHAGRKTVKGEDIELAAKE